MLEVYIRKMKFEEARKKFLQELEFAFAKGHSQIEVIHGIGDYILRNMVHNEVAKIDYAEMQEPTLVSNPGSSIVKLLGPDQSVLKKYMG